MLNNELEIKRFKAYMQDQHNEQEALAAAGQDHE